MSVSLQRTQIKTMNEARAEWARLAVVAFNDVVAGDMEFALSDLLVDLAHMCAAQGDDPGAIFKQALQTYQTEVTEDHDLSAPN